MAQTVKCLSTMRETWVRSMGWEDPLEKEMAESEEGGKCILMRVKAESEKAGLKHSKN